LNVFQVVLAADCQRLCGGDCWDTGFIRFHSQNEHSQVMFVFTEYNNSFEPKRRRSATDTFICMIRCNKSPSSAAAAELAFGGHDFWDASRTNRCIFSGRAFDDLAADRTERRTKQIEEAGERKHILTVQD
jgi:hypothetical protein